MTIRIIATIRQPLIELDVVIGGGKSLPISFQIEPDPKPNERTARDRAMDGDPDDEESN